MNEKQTLLHKLLEGLAQQPGMLGSALVSRDGIRVVDAWKKEVWNKETFSAMSATLMGAAEVALSDLGGSRARRVIAETPKIKMVVVGATDELVLVTLSDDSLPMEKLLPAVDEAASKAARIITTEGVAKVVKGG